MRDAEGNVIVSIPRSEFCLFGLLIDPVDRLRVYDVSIPRSEFCLFGQKSLSASSCTLASFNSPLGILFVRTTVAHSCGLCCAAVSIPRSEFCLFGLISRPATPLNPVKVSIPRSEFCLFGLHILNLPIDKCLSFNSPLGILFVRTTLLPGRPGTTNLFQFPARNSVCSDSSRILTS